MKPIAILGLIFLLVLTGCSKEQRAVTEDEHEHEVEMPPAGSAPDPCALLTASNLQETLGEDLINTEPAPSDDPSLGQCTLDTSAFAGRIIVATSRHASVDEARAAFQIGAEGSQPVNELGDEAYSTAESGQLEIKARKDVLLLRLTLVTDSPAGLDQIKVLALKAMARV